ncbi:MAG: hypothetical protein HUU28_03945 [Planctomycetaceae bacterium]|nr:hypothetical protein [Planctomycetaceae bacterium]
MSNERCARVIQKGMNMTLKSLGYSAAFACSLSAIAAGQTIWYVDASAPAPGNGTAGAPFTAIAPALAASAHGDEIQVAPGLYFGNFQTPKRVRVWAPGGPLATVIRPTTGTQWTIFSTGCCQDRFELEGFTVHGGVRAEYGSVTRCIFIGGGVGLAIGTGFDCSVDHCTIQGYEAGVAPLLHGAQVRVNNSILESNGFDFLEELPGNYNWWRSFSVSGSVFHSGMGPAGLFNGPGHDYHLAPGSGCIDAADPAAPLDPDGTRSDIGALPFDAAYAPFSTYCTAKTNSQGCIPAIGAINNASLSSSRPFWITCSQQLNERSGLLFYGFRPKSTPYQGGYLCVESPTRRSPLLHSGGNSGGTDCSGSFAYDFNERIHSGADTSLTLAAEVYAQFWSRDPAASFGNNRSDAIAFVIQP